MELNKVFIKWYFACLIALTIYLLENFLLVHVLGGVITYYAHSVLWILFSIMILRFSFVEVDRKWEFSSSFIPLAMMIGISQTSLWIFSGVVTSFGKSPYAFTPQAIAFNLIYFLSSLFGVELLRAYLIGKLSQNKETLSLIFTSLFCTLILFPPARLLSLFTLSGYPEIFCSDFLPTFAENLLASYLVLLQGPIASIAYRGTLEMFKWLFPILPDPTWPVKSLFGVLAPTLGFLIADVYMGQEESLKRKGEPTTQKWLYVAIVLTIGIYFSTGLLGIYPVVIISGSMRPTIDVGDIAIIVKIPPDRIELNDIIQYFDGEKTLVHRVVGFKQIGSNRLFITKGDANNAPDPAPVHPNQVMGRLWFVIPKLGWIKIYIEFIIEEILKIFSNLFI